MTIHGTAAHQNSCVGGERFSKFKENAKNFHIFCLENVSKITKKPVDKKKV
jgi:hypothetical protein